MKRGLECTHAHLHVPPLPRPLTPNPQDMAGKLDQLVQGNTTKHVRELQATIDQLRRELDVKTRRILQLEALPAGQQGVAPASQAQANLLVVQAGAGMLGGLGGAGMLAAQGLDDTLLLEQQVQQAQAELQHHQAQAQAAAQTHSVTLAHTQALHAEVRNLAALQKQQVGVLGWELCVQ